MAYGSCGDLPVTIHVPPESLWGYELVTSAYDEKPDASRERIIAHVRNAFPEAGAREIKKLIG